MASDGTRVRTIQRSANSGSPSRRARHVHGARRAARRAGAGRDDRPRRQRELIDVGVERPRPQQLADVRCRRRRRSRAESDGSGRSTGRCRRTRRARGAAAARRRRRRPRRRRSRAASRRAGGARRGAAGRATAAADRAPTPASFAASEANAAAPLAALPPQDHGAAPCATSAASRKRRGEDVGAAGGPRHRLAVHRVDREQQAGAQRADRGAGPSPSNCAASAQKRSDASACASTTERWKAKGRSPPIPRSTRYVAMVSGR